MKGRKKKPCAVEISESITLVLSAKEQHASGLSDIESEERERIESELKRLGVFSTIDRAAIEIYCGAYARWRKAQESIEVDGLYMNTDLGGVKTNPAVQAAASAESTMTKLLAEFGLTPGSRSRVAGQVTDKEDALDKFNSE